MTDSAAIQLRSARIDQFLRDHLDSYIAEVAGLCAQPSITARGEGISAMANLVEQTLQRRGLRVHRFETPGSPVLVASAAGKSPRTLLFYNHYDVQPPEPLELWTTPPFLPTLRDGALFARGAMDDKGQWVARLAAVDAVRHIHNGEYPCGITFILEGEEEIGSPNIAEFVRTHVDLLKSDGAIWEEGYTNRRGQPVTSLGKRGILYVELQVTTMAHDAHSGAASVLPNGAWRLLNALSTLKDPDGRIRIPGFYDAARPPSSLDLELLDANPSDEEQLREEYSVVRFVDGLTGRAYQRAVFNPTCNIAGIWAGYQGPGMKTVIPAVATAKLDFRLVPDQDPTDIFGKLRAHLDASGYSDVDLRWTGAMWPAKVPGDHPFVLLTTRTGEEVYGQPALRIPLTGGSSPVYAFTGPLGIPVVDAGVAYPGSRAHAPDENLRLQDFYQGARHLARIVDGFASLLS